MDGSDLKDENKLGQTCNKLCTNINFIKHVTKQNVKIKYL